MSVTVLPPPRLGNLGAALCEALAYLHSPASIDHEIAYLLQRRAQGDHSTETTVQLADWRAVREAQRRLVGELSEAS